MITKSIFGKLNNGETVYEYIVDNGTASASILTYGATVRTLKVPSKKGMLDVVLGYDTLEEYVNNGGYLGAVIGRNSNRVKGANFQIFGKKITLNINDRGCNNLHGGIKGFNAQNFTVTSVNESENSIEFCLFSPNGDEGFTGNMFLYVTYTLDGSSLDIEYSAKCDENTVCNLTNHSYFNLSGAGEKIALDTYLKIDADNFTPLDNDLVTTGEILSVSGTPFDFREFKKIDRDIECDNAQLKIMGGYDVNFCLNNGGIYKKVISAYNENSGITLDVYTDRIGVQLYSGNFLSGVKGKGGATYPKRSGFCLETQTYPGALNNPNFPSVILKANEKYFAKTTYKFGLL